MNKKSSFNPVGSNERIHVLDALRGFAIFGIFMINARVFSGYAYMLGDEKNELLLADWNPVFDIFHTVFFSGKFYTLFSLMFGIGFAIQFIRASSADQSFNRHFSRRLFILLIIGVIHLWGIWFSDILVLYALCGYVLIFFQSFSNRALLWAGFLTLCIPGLYIWYLNTNDGGYVNHIYEYLNQQWNSLDLPHSNENNYFQMRDVVEIIQSSSWSTVLTFNYIGPLLRGYIYALDARFFNVLGVFIIGLWTGRQLMLHKLHENRSLLIKIAVTGFIFGLILNIGFVMDAPAGLDNATFQLIKEMLEPIGYLFLTAGYVAAFMLLYLTRFRQVLTKLFNSVGKTALTNYILQSFIGIFLFYGIGLGLGEYLGSAYLTLAVFVVFVFQILISSLWLMKFKYGPLEWIWRVLTYGRLLSNKKKREL
ncbi:DUF418 domain-containing protein [Rhodohalobacter sp. SW132]|uniref:DUF418 domain-containing protein n=1 Tax=Rhodohalobacter sp. SW132 TaxID=2293433 RepID=UPI000E27BB8E|nr:DUF418 domain-containing protein [Rhodohalobacter sp. SW132]REL39176.1 DUF418 domain-containing protein [Rhodohalobacter sp. SW132]